MAVSIADVLRSAWQEFLGGAQVFLPHLLAMLSLVVAGWLIAWLLSFILLHVLRWVRFDVLADRAGLTPVLKKVAIPPPSRVVASMLFWVIWAGFVLSGLGALGLSGMDNLTADFVALLPRLAVGIVILIAGLLAAKFAWRATLLAAVNAKMRSARLVSGALRWLIIALSIAMALEQIGVAKTIMLTAFAIAFGAVMLGAAIAIGIGGGPVARRYFERQFPDPPPEEATRPDEISHL